MHRSDDMIIAVPESALERTLVFIVGSLDGDLIHLITIFKQCQMPPKSHYIFL
ncbi:hypothetical protein LOAG_15927, partial [Loa loa]